MNPETVPSSVTEDLARAERRRPIQGRSRGTIYVKFTLEESSFLKVRASGIWVKYQIHRSRICALEMMVK